MFPGTPTRVSVVYAGEVITIRELPRQEIGVSFSDPTSRKEWLYDGSYNKNTILAVAGANVPVIDICGGVSRFFERYDCKEQGGGAWVVTAQYKSKPAYWELSIKTTGGTAKMLQSYRTVRGYDCTNQTVNEDPTDWRSYDIIRDFNKAIGVNGNSVEGVEIIIPTLDITINYKFTLSTLSASYIQTLFHMTGSANDAPFTLAWKGQSVTFIKGELRFLGAPLKQTSDDQVEITFNFSASANSAGGTVTVQSFIQPPVGGTVIVFVDSLLLLIPGNKIYIVGEEDGERLDVGVFTINYMHIPGGWIRLTRVATPGSVAAGTVIPAFALVSADHTDRFPLAIGRSAPIKKEGWEYLWVCYEEGAEADTGRMVKRPVSAYVEQVTKYANFATLGII